jgi:formylglycine-generating enzyme required for sulfatase activity
LTCSGYRSVPGFCPGPTEIQCCVVDDMGDAGACDESPSWDDMPRPNEGLVEAAGDPGCPAGMVAVEAFCVDRYEGSLVEVLDGGVERSWSPYFNPGTRAVRAVSIAGAVPQGYISGAQAGDACARASKRLCTDAEWLRACQGAAGSTYPYGETREDGWCNDARAVHPVIEYFDSSDPSIWSMLDNACIGQQHDTVEPSGSRAQCATAEGAFDMMGNLHEWTSDPAGTFRGGFYVDTTINGDGCLYATTAHDVAHWDYSTGFRCCADGS